MLRDRGSGISSLILCQSSNSEQQSLIVGYENGLLAQFDITDTLGSADHALDGDEREPPLMLIPVAFCVMRTSVVSATFISSQSLIAVGLSDGLIDVLEYPSLGLLWSGHPSVAKNDFFHPVHDLAAHVGQKHLLSVVNDGDEPLAETVQLPSPTIKHQRGSVRLTDSLHDLAANSAASTSNEKSSQIHRKRVATTTPAGGAKSNDETLAAWTRGQLSSLCLDKRLLISSALQQANLQKLAQQRREGNVTVTPSGVRIYKGSSPFDTPPISAEVQHEVQTIPTDLPTFDVRPASRGMIRSSGRLQQSASTTKPLTLFDRVHNSDLSLRPGGVRSYNPPTFERKRSASSSSSGSILRPLSGSVGVPLRPTTSVSKEPVHATRNSGVTQTGLDLPPWL